MLIKVDQFAGMTEAVSTRLLQEKFATKAVNCRVDRGKLEPYKGYLTPIRTLPFGTKTIYKYAGQHWFTWDKDVDVAKIPTAYDVTDRILYTGDTFPKQTRNDIALGVDNRVNGWYRLGVPAPSTAPWADLIGEPVSEEDENHRQELIYYVYTYVSGWGEEGPPSAISRGIDWTAGQVVDVTTETSPPNGQYNFANAKKRIYRSNAGTQAGAFQYVGEMPISQVVFNDRTEWDSLGEVIPSTLWDPPPDENTARFPAGQMLGVRTLSSGALVGFSGNTLVYSVPYLAHAWPYQYPVRDKIVAIEVTNTGVLVATEGRPAMAIGFDPQSIVIQEVDEYQACVSKRSMVDMGEYAIYASPDGLVGMENGSVEVLTRGLFRPEQWQRFKPDTIHAYRWENKYVGFYQKDGQQGGFIFTPGDQHNAFVELNFYSDACYYDPLIDKLYMMAEFNRLYIFNEGAALPYYWRSKKFELPKPTPMNVMQVIADNYPIEITLHRDGVEDVYLIPSSDPIRIAAGRAKTWQFAIEGTEIVHSVAIGSSMSELANA